MENINFLLKKLLCWVVGFVSLLGGGVKVFIKVISTQLHPSKNRFAYQGPSYFVPPPPKNCPTKTIFGASLIYRVDSKPTEVALFSPTPLLRLAGVDGNCDLPTIPEGDQLSHHNILIDILSIIIKADPIHHYRGD